MPTKFDLTVVQRDGKSVIAFENQEYTLMQARLAEQEYFVGQLASSFARSFERQMAFYGLSVGAGKKVAGEFVLSTKLAPLTSIGMPKDHVCVSVHLRNDTLSQVYPVMFTKADFERIKTSLRERDDYEDGLTGPRGSVFVLGETETRGTWPARQTVLHAKDWLVLGNTNDMEHLIKEQAKAGFKTIKLAYDVWSMSRKFSPRS